MLEELKERVCKANIQLRDSGLVILTWGNVSAIDRESNLIVIKPSGVSYDELTPDKMVVVDMSGRVVEGELNPSSDTPTHIVLYQAFPEIGGVVHTHSRYATIWAQAGLDIIAYGTTHADYFYGDVPCTMQLTDDQVEENYEVNTGYAITDTFARRRIGALEMPACLVAQHGPFAWGTTPEKAVENAIVLEEVAHMAVFNTNFQFGLTRISEALLDKHYLRKHGENAYYGQTFGKVTELANNSDTAVSSGDEFQIMPSEHTVELKNMSQIGEVVPPVIHKPPKKEEAVFKAADAAFAENFENDMDASFDIQPSVPDEAGAPLMPNEPDAAGEPLNASFPDAWGEPIRPADFVIPVKQEIPDEPEIKLEPVKQDIQPKKESGKTPFFQKPSLFSKFTGGSKNTAPAPEPVKPVAPAPEPAKPTEPPAEPLDFTF